MIDRLNYNILHYLVYLIATIALAKKRCLHITWNSNHI